MTRELRGNGRGIRLNGRMCSRTAGPNSKQSTSRWRRSVAMAEYALLLGLFMASLVAITVVIGRVLVRR